MSIRLATISATIAALWLSTAGGQEARGPVSPEAIELIQLEMQRLRDDYDQRMRLLEERLRQLEQGATNPAAGAAALTNEIPLEPIIPVVQQTVAEAQRANAATRLQEFADQEFAETTSTREYALSLDLRRPIKDRVEQVLADFIDIGGYFRAGYGRDNQGGPQVAFQAPGAPAKYRLGNEAENYGELIFAKNFYVPNLFALDPQIPVDPASAGPIARVQVRMSIYNPYSDYSSTDATTFGLPEAWGAIGNVFQSQPGVTFWAGNRFYRRYDIHINDFYYYNMSGGGGGIEGLDLGFGTFAFAWLGGASQSALYSSVPQPEPDNLAGFAKSNFDFRLYDTRLPFGTGEFGLAVSRAAAGQDEDGRSLPSRVGVAFDFVHTAEKFLDSESINRFSLQIGNGPARTFTSGFETITTPDGTFIEPGGPDSWRFRLTDSLVVQPWPQFAIGPAFVYQHTHYGNDEGGGDQDWWSAGVRPVWFFNKYFNTALETGVDWVRDTKLGTSDYVWKITLAPQVSLGDRFYSRPVLRVFITYARWGDEFVDAVGGPDYRGLNSGFTYGMQMESWW